MVFKEDWYMDMATLSKYSRIEKYTFKEHKRYKKLPSLDVRGKILVRVSDYDAWVERYLLKEVKKGILDLLR